MFLRRGGTGSLADSETLRSSAAEILADSGTLEVGGTFDDSLTFAETERAGGYPHRSRTQHVAPHEE